MHTDHGFQIGKTHFVCEDYAFSDERMIGVCDGCSASPNVDFGARIIGELTKTLTLSDVCWEPDFHLLYKFQDVKSHFSHLRSNFLDATLLFAVLGINSIRINVFGDGVIFIKTNEKIVIVDFEYLSGAPYYLSYRLNDERNKEYQTNCKQDLIQTAYVLDLDWNFISKVEKKESPLFFYSDRFSTENVKQISLLSDGIHTFHDADNQEMEFLPILRKLVEYKNTNGDFVERRMKMFQRENEKLGIYHNDDISVASMIFA